MIKIISILVLGTVVFSAFLTPFIYSFLVYLIPSFPWPFSRVFDRVAMLVVLVFVLYFRKEFDLKKFSLVFKQQISAYSKIGSIIKGIIISLSISVVALFIIADQMQIVWAEKTASQVIIKLLMVLPAALLISFIEEGFFRGLLFPRLKDSLPLVGAIAASSLLYAVCHFITPDKTFSYKTFSAFAGFDYLVAVANRLTLPGTWQACLGLFFVGVVLATTFQISKSIYLSIGLHTGWILSMKFAFFSLKLDDPALAISAGAGRRYFLAAQPIGWISIFCVLIFATIIFKKLKTNAVQA